MFVGDNSFEWRRTRIFLDKGKGESYDLRTDRPTGRFSAGLRRQQADFPNKQGLFPSPCGMRGHSGGYDFL